MTLPVTVPRRRNGDQAVGGHCDAETSMNIPPSADRVASRSRDKHPMCGTALAGNTLAELP
jgi:hypothetical protein